MIDTYKSKCCMNCRFAERVAGGDMGCAYDDGAKRPVRPDDTCAGWEPLDACSFMEFQKPVEKCVVKSYDVTLKVAVKGLESEMRYAERVGRMLSDAMRDCLEGEAFDGREVLLAEVEAVSLHDQDAPDGTP